MQRGQPSCKPGALAAGEATRGDAKLSALGHGGIADLTLSRDRRLRAPRGGLQLLEGLKLPLRQPCQYRGELEGCCFRHALPEQGVARLVSSQGWSCAKRRLVRRDGKRRKLRVALEMSNPKLCSVGPRNVQFTSAVGQPGHVSDLWVECLVGSHYAIAEFDAHAWPTGSELAEKPVAHFHPMRGLIAQRFRAAAGANQRGFVVQPDRVHVTAR